MALNNRYDFVMLFDVENGNPNGDPDAGNSPRVDAETGYGYVTDVCLKRKIRNYVELVKEGEGGYNIIIKPDRNLDTKFTEALGPNATKDDIDKNRESVITVRDYVCKNYFDARAFGVVITAGAKYAESRIRGPVQINFAKSLSPVNCQDVTITRQAKTNEDREGGGDTEIGKKSMIPYGLYRAEGYISAALANKITGLSEDDVELLWEAIINMFENDHSAARGKMCMRKLYVFKHDNVLGCAPSHILFDKIKIAQKCDVPRKFEDYEIDLDKNMPAGVTLIEKL